MEHEMKKDRSFWLFVANDRLAQLLVGAILGAVFSKLVRLIGL